MDNRMDNLTLIPSWISKQEQNSILAFRCTESHAWAGRSSASQNLTNPLSLEEEILGSESESTASEESGFGRGSLRNGNSSHGANTEEKQSKRQGENSLYWKAITQLLANETDEVIFHILILATSSR